MGGAQDLVGDDRVDSRLLPSCTLLSLRLGPRAYPPAPRRAAAHLAAGRKCSLNRILECVLLLECILFPILLQHLRQGRAGGTDVQKDALRQLLSDTDVEIIWRSRHRPLAVVRMLAAIVQVCRCCLFCHGSRSLLTLSLAVVGMLAGMVQVGRCWQVSFAMEVGLF